MLEDSAEDRKLEVEVLPEPQPRKDLKQRQAQVDWGAMVRQPRLSRGSPQGRQQEEDEAASAPPALWAQPTAILGEAPKAKRRAEGVGSRTQLSSSVVVRKRKAEAEAAGPRWGPAPPSWGACHSREAAEPCPQPPGASCLSQRGAHGAVVKQERLRPEREAHRPRGREDGQHREPSWQEARRARHRDPGPARGPSRPRTSSADRPGSGPPQGGRRDSRSLQAREAGRECYKARRPEHRQRSEGHRHGHSAREALPVPGGNRKGQAGPVEGKPSLELSGALLRDTNTFRGVVIPYGEPPEARTPHTRWRLYPFKNDELLPVLYIHRQSAYLVGRHRGIADIPLDHPSCSKQHAVLQYRLVEYSRADGTLGRRVKPYIMDLGSGNGTFLNNERIQPQRYYELKEKDVLRFGFSTREYVLLHESSHASEGDGKEDADEHEQSAVSHS